MYLAILHYVVVSTDYRPGDQSGCPEDPQTLLDCCYFLPPVCDWKRRSSAFILIWAVFYSNQPFTARTGSGKKRITGMTIVKERTRRATFKEETSDLSSDICQRLRAQSVNNQTQNAPSVIPRVLLVCLPGNRLGNQHGNHIQQPVLYLWMMCFGFSSLQ